jgi:hypothetical protein
MFNSIFIEILMPITTRTYYTTSSTGLSTTTSTSYIDKVALTFTPEASSTYAIFWSGVISGSSITNFNNVRLHKTTGTAVTFQEFSIDRDELLEENALIGTVIYTSSASPTEESFAVQFNTSVGTDTIGLSDTYITALKLSDASSDTYQTDLTVTSSNVNTYSSVNSITVGPGNWYIIGSATVNVNTTTAGSRGLTGIRIYNASTTSGSMEHDSWYPESANNFTAYYGVITASVASNTTFELQLKDNSAGSSSLRERTLLALRRDAFSNGTSNYSVNETETFSFLANVTQVSLTASLDAEKVKALVIGSWVTTPTNEASSQAQSNFRQDGVNLFTYAGQILAEGQTLYDLFQNGYAGVITVSSGSKFDIRQGGNSALLSQSIKNASILVLPLEESFPTRRVRYVNTDSTPGGDGTTNNTTGANRAYASLSSSLVEEKIVQSNLITGDETLEIRCSGTTVPDTASVEILGWTTSPRNYILITTGSSSQRAVSPWDTNRYRLSVNNDRTITSYESVTIDGLQLENTATDSAVIRLFDANSNETTIVKNCYLKADNATGINVAISQNSSFYGINNLISGSNLSNYGMFIAGDVGVLPNTKYYIYNNTFVGFQFEHIYITLNEVGDTASIKNNLFYRGYSTAERTFRTTTTSGSQIYETNASSDGWAPANTSNGGTLRNRTFTFENGSLGDYHLSTSDVGAKNLGVDLSADVYYSFNNDFDLITRGSSWDIGAFEVVATSLSAGGTLVNISTSGIGKLFRISQSQIGSYIQGNQ